MLGAALGIGNDGLLPSDPFEQFANAFEAVRAVFEEAGSGLADIVEMTTFHIGLIGRTRDVYEGAGSLSHGTLACTDGGRGGAELGLPGALLEIKVTAVLGAGCS